MTTGQHSGVARLYRRTFGKLRNAVLLIRKKGVRDIVTRRVLVPLGVVPARTGDGATRFAPYQVRARSQPRTLRVALLADPTLETCLGFDAELLSLRRDAQGADLVSFAPSFLLVTARGLRFENGDAPLAGVLARCRELGVPSALWIDDDSVGFGRLLSLARGFDLVYATHAEVVTRFQREIGEDRVFLLPVAVQPALHNPSQRGAEQRPLCWLGSLAELRRLPHGDAFRRLVETAERQGLDVIEALPSSGAAGEPALPRREDRRLGYEQVLTAYRGYRAFLARDFREPAELRQALELIACGTRLIGLAAPPPPLPEQVVTVLPPESNAAELLQVGWGNDGEGGVAAHRAYRGVLREHSYARRLSAIREQLGEGGEVPEPPLVSILAATNRPERLDNVLENFDRQTHPRLELVLLLNSNAYDVGAVRERVGSRASVRVFQLDEALTLSDCLNHGIDNSSGSWVAKFDDDDHYGSEYLADLLLCERFTDASVLGKRAYHVYLEQSDRTAIRFWSERHRYVEFVHGGTLLIRREVFDQIRFEPMPRGADTAFQRACRKRGLSIYSSDPYNFVHVRHGADSLHTWSISDRELLEKCTQIRPGLSLEEIMV